MSVFFDISISLDGYAAGPNPSMENPLGEGGELLHEWVVKLAYFKEVHGDEGAGGETGPADDMLRAAFERTGAHVMGREMFGGGPGDWGDGSWKGWWGDEPPFHAPVFVVTHHARDPEPMEGGTTFHFVTDGVESAVAQARDAAGGKDVAVSGGPSVIQQALAAGLVDEFSVHVVPVLLGGGTRLFDVLEKGPVSLERTRVLDTDDATHITYRVSGR